MKPIPTTPSAAEIEPILRTALPEVLHAHASGLAGLVAAAAEGALSPEDIQGRIAADPALAPLLLILAGQAIGAGTGAIHFGVGNQVGTVSVGDVAGRDVIKVSPRIIIHQTYSSILGPAPPDHRASVLRMIEDYRAIFGGRMAELDVLDNFLCSGDRPCALLLAPTGRGKTALLIHWVARVQAAGSWTVVFAPISRRYGTASAGSTLSLLARALASLHDESLQGYNTSPDQLRPLVAEYLRREPSGGRRLLLILDGLDEAVGWEVARDLFPRSFGPHIRAVASARQVAQRSHEDWLGQLGWDARATVTLSLAALDRDGVADILSRMGDPLAKTATDVDLLGEVTRVSQGDPLTIRLLVEALAAGDCSPGRLMRLPPGLESYVRDWLEELEQQGGKDQAVWMLLGLCATALGPLTSEDLEGLARAEFAKRIDQRRAAMAVARFVIGDGESQSGYVFSHPRLKELFLERLLRSEEQDGYKQKFVDYGQEWYKHRARALPDYLRQFWVAHAAEVGAWDPVRQVLTEVVPTDTGFQQPWAAARHAAEGSYTGYLADLDLLWRRAETSHDLGLGLRCALFAASIRSLGLNLPAELLVQLVAVGTREGRWTPAAALEHVRSMPNPAHQSNALWLFLASGITLPWGQMLDIAMAISDDNSRAEALAELIPHLPEELLPDALRAGHSIPDELKEHHNIDSPMTWYSITRRIRTLLGLDYEPGPIGPHNRATILKALAARMPSCQRLDLYGEALIAVSRLTDERRRLLTLERLLPDLPDELLPSALEVARALTKAELRAEALFLLASRLPPPERGEVCREALAAELGFNVVDSLKLLPDDLLAEGVEAITKVSYLRLKAELLEELLPRLPEELLAKVLAMSRILNDGTEKVALLATLARQLPANQQASVLTEALDAARRIWEATEKADALRTLVACLPADERASVSTEALDAARAIFKRAERASRLKWLASLLPPYQQASVLAEALEVARRIRDKTEKADALRTLAECLPADQQAGVFAEALDAARAISDRVERVRSLTEVAGGLPLDQRRSVYREAMIAARTMRHRFRDFADVGRGSILLDLPPELLEAHWRDALEIADGVSDRRLRAMLLVALGSRLPASDQADLNSKALTVAQGISDDGVRAESLLSLEFSAFVNSLPTPLRATGRLVGNLLRTMVTLIRWTGDAGFRAEGRLLRIAFRPLIRSIRGPLVRLVDAIDTPRTFYRAVSILGPFLSEELLPPTLAAAHKYPSLSSYYLVTLSKLALRLPEGRRAEVYSEIQTLYDSLDHDLVRASVLEALAQAFPQNLILRILQLTNSLSPAGDYRVDPLKALAPRLPEDHLADALKCACEIAWDWSRAQALLALAPRLVASARTRTADRAGTLAAWQGAVRTVAGHGRAGLLSSLTALQPWLAVLASPKTLNEVSIAVRDSAQIWP